VGGSLAIASRAADFSDLLQSTLVSLQGGSPRDLESALDDFCDRLAAANKAGKHLYVVGNGGSAAVAAHAVTDFVNTARLRATTLHEPSLLTCMTNDYGYENAFAQVLKGMMRAGDVVVAISSSGQSMNIRNLALEAERNQGFVITLSGFKESNPLRSMGQLNFWLDSHDYGMVEIGHQFLLHNVSDRLRKRSAGEHHE
jgi:D-sedoheptulose 7-phosphate isomerase